MVWSICTYFRGVSLVLKPLTAIVVLWLGMAGALSAQDRGELGSRVEWSDIKLLDGRVLRAEDLRGRVVVIQMWASWCPFCALQNPHIQKLADANRERGLLVLAVSIDRTEQAARDYLKKNGYTFDVAMQTPQFEQWLGKRRALPETFVVDASGKVVFSQRGEMFGDDIGALARFAAGPL
ncbi:MAG: TlpA disulfide reductase family protein [Burkholderiaceae bacterium]